MLTLFTIPKAFEGHIGLIQDNALASWSRLGVEVLLLGDDPGVAERAERFGYLHVPDIDRNEFGTPLISSMFRAAAERASNPWLCYVNADIILMSDFAAALTALCQRPALVIGRRWNLDLREPLAFEDAWEQRLRERLDREGERGGRYAIDYFIYRPEVFAQIPDFAIGRHHWDNWLVYRARALGYPVIDASEQVRIVHQNHGYGRREELTDADLRRGQEALTNRRLTGGHHYGFNLDQATHRFTGSELQCRGLREMGRHWLVTRVATVSWLFALYAWGLRAAELAVPSFIKAPLRRLVSGSSS